MNYNLFIFALLSSSVVAVDFNYNDPDRDWCRLQGITTFCCDTFRQSPINIIPGNAVTEPLYTANPLTFGLGYFQAVSTGRYGNNGHTATYYPEDNVVREITGGPCGCDVYELVQFHFHWGDADIRGSEHSLNGNFFPLEVHFVHINRKYPNSTVALIMPDGFAVMGVFFYISNEDNDFFNGLDRLGRISNENDETNLAVDLMPLLRFVSSGTYTSYPGSLTTPLCQESVTWINFLTPVPVSSKTMGRFRTRIFEDNGQTLLVNNFRPVQPLNGRVLSTP